MKKCLFSFIILITMLCGGCWNYRSLDEMSIVSGLAIDQDKSTGLFLVSFQIVDLSGNVETEGVTGKLVEAQGATLLDAARNANRRIVGRLYFGHTQTVILGSDFAKNNRIGSTIDWLLRDSELRETFNLVISTDKNAAEILRYESIVNPIVAFEISNNIAKENDISTSTVNVQVYQVFNNIHTEGIELTLPAIHNVINNGETVSEINGTAMFKDQKMIGLLSPTESKYLLFILNQIKGGILTFPALGQGQDDSVLEIDQNQTDTSFIYEDGKLKFRVAIETNAHLSESRQSLNAVDKKQIAVFENAAAKALADRTYALIRKVQTEYNSDIFGFGNLIYRQNNALWNRLKSDWEQLFPLIEVEVRAKVNIFNSASLKKS